MSFRLSLKHIIRSGVAAASFFGMSLLAQTITPPVAVNDDLTATPFSASAVKVITEATLIANDTGTGKNISGLSSSTSTGGAGLGWNGGLNQVTYDPTNVAAFIALDSDSDPVNDTFSYRLTGTAGGTSTATVTVAVQGVNDAPTLTGIDTTTLEVDDNDGTNTPFGGALIEDPDTGEEVTVTITVTDADEGAIGNLDGFTDDGLGVYSYTGTTANATSKLRALTFIPAIDTIAPGETENTVLTVRVDDGTAPSVSVNRTVEVTSINDIPVVTPGATVSQNDTDTVAIFNAVELEDPDYLEELTLTVTFDATKGVLSGTDFSSPTAGELTSDSALSVSDAQAALRGLEFTPEPDLVPTGEVFNVVFTIEADDGDDIGSDDLTVTVLSVNDPPVLTPATLPNVKLSGGAAARLFSSVTLADLDFDDVTIPDPAPNPPQPPGDDFTATITLAPSPYGAIGSSVFVPGSVDDTYTYTATRLEVEAAIQELQYIAPSTVGDFTVSLKVDDSSGADNSTSNTVVVTVEVTQPVPGLSGLLGGQALFDNAVIFPFASASFRNFGGVDRLVEVSLNNDSLGSLGNLGLFSRSADPAPYTYSMIGNSVSATAALQALRFEPTRNEISGDQTVTFTISVKAEGGGSLGMTPSTLAVTVRPFNDAPTIISDSPELRVNDDAKDTTPFATVSVVDLDENGMQTVTVTISLIGEDPDTNTPRAGGGTLAAPTASDLTATGTYPDITYTFSGQPDAVNSLLQSIVFTPEPNRNAVGERETVTFTVTVEDGKGGVVQNSNTSVIVTSVNGAPEIREVPLLSEQPFPLPSTGNLMAMPFAELEVDDEEDLTFTITLDDKDKGTLAGDDFTSSDGGLTYVYDGTDKSPAAIQAALRALTYTISSSYAFPAGQPGLTTFTLEAEDSTNLTSKVLTVFLRERNVSHIVTSDADNGAGSLREAIALAGNGDMIAFDFQPDEFPVVITLESLLVIDKNLTIVGSGVDQLTIRGDGSAGLFSVGNGAQFTVEQITFSDGAAGSYGGAISVGSGCGLVARLCSFEGNTAGQFGGAIDVFEGELVVEKCLFRDNAVVGSTATAGGAISVFTALPSSITNSTFVGNRQENGGGDGGGALYAQNADLAQFFDLRVEHCTFVDNVDAATSGGAILSASAGLLVHVRNNIFSSPPVSGPLLDVLGGGRFNSLGGNIATDSTETTYTQGAQNIIILRHPDDLKNTDPMLGSLSDNAGPTLTFAPLPGSPAIDGGVAVDPVSEALGTDQRGVWRGGSIADVGAFETGTFKRLNINEIFVGADMASSFIEFYNPRESEALNLAGLSLFVEGEATPRHTFTSRSLVPGGGYAWTPTFLPDAEKDTIILKNPAGQVVLLVDYVTGFSEGGVELDTTGESITRYPRFEGGFLPHKRVVENVTGTTGGSSKSPGNDVTGAELGGGNAPPIAVPDGGPDEVPGYTILANQILEADLRLNDIEFDRTDFLKITEVMALSAGEVTNAELLDLAGDGSITISNLPAGLDTSITTSGPAVTPTDDKFGITYNPISSDIMIALNAGQEQRDIWAYTIRDFDAAGAAQPRGPVPTDPLDPFAKETENITKATSYFTVTVIGVNEAPVPGDDSASTHENQPLRFLADNTLRSTNPDFNFGDNPANYQDLDAMGDPLTVLPVLYSGYLLSNDDDVDEEDSNLTLLPVAVHTTADPADLLVATSELGAAVTLDIRAEREETNIIYDPRSSAILDALAAGEVATDSFHYSVFDKRGARGVAKVTITVTGVNDVPTAVDDSGFVANEDTLLVIPGADLLANDTDPDQNGAGPDDSPAILTPFDMESSLGAQLVFDGTEVTYDPRTIDVYESLARNEAITDTLTYTITDAMGGTSQATVTVIVEGRNDRPVAANDGLDILENQTLEIDPVSGLLANDGDVDINGSTPDDDPWVLPQREVTTPLGAMLDINPDGSYRYDANSPAIDSLIENELAVETFPYTLVDNFRTTASDDTFRVLANREEVPLPVLSNDAVVGSDWMPVLAYFEGPGTPGAVVIESPNHALRDGLLVQVDGYAGDGSYNGVYPVTSIDRDHFSIPVAFEDDPEGMRGSWRPWFAITSVGPTDAGGVVTAPDGQTLLYTPADGFFGTEMLTYTIEDGVGGQDVGTVRVEVILPPLNGFISAGADRFRIGMGELAVEVDVLANDNTRPAPGGDLMILSTSPLGGAVGLLELVNDGRSLRYTPPTTGFTGEESFTYTVSGGGTSTAQATVTFEVEDRSGLLSGAQDAFYVVVGSENNLLDVLANDPLRPTYPVSSTLVSVGTGSTEGTTGGGGTVTLSGNMVSYTPPPSLISGGDTFSYTARDASGATTTETVQVRVVPEAPDFYATADHYTVVAGSGPIQLPVLLNDGAVQIEGAILNVVSLGLDTDLPPSFERVSIANGTAVLYTPPGSATIEDFNYEIGIGTIERREAKITIEVVDASEVLPDAEDDFYRVAKNSGPHTLDVLSNDLPYPLAGWNWTIASATAGDQQGTVAVNAEGTSLGYTPEAGFFGTETFTYTIVDIFGDVDTATVTVRVGELITAPDAFTVLEGSIDNPLFVLANDDLLDTFAPDYTISGVDAASAGGGAPSMSGSGPNNHLLYTPAAGFVGEDTFSYTVEDQTGDSRTEVVTVSVIAVDSDRDDAVLRVQITGVNDVPVLGGTSDGSVNDKQTINPFATVSITDVDAGGDQQQTVRVSYDASYGTVSGPGLTRISEGVYQLVGTPALVSTRLNSLVFDPYENLIDYINPGFDGVVFTLSIDDGYIATPILDDTTIWVFPVNDAPTISGAIPDQVVQVNSLPLGFCLPSYFADVDDDVAGGDLTWTVTGNTNPALFDAVTVDPQSLFLELDFAGDQAGVADITVRGTDRGLLSVETTFRVTVEGPPVVVLAPGETKPPAASFLLGSEVGSRRDYRQAFRVRNDGTLPAEAFIVHVLDLDERVPAIIVNSAAFSSDERGTPDNFLDDLRSSAGVSIREVSSTAYAVKYDVPIPAGESVVVHLTYRATTLNLISIQPTIEIELSTLNPVAEPGISDIARRPDGQIELTVNVLAGRSYRLEYSADLLTWSPWRNALPVTLFDQTFRVVDDGLNTGLRPTEVSGRHYRLLDITDE